MPIPTSWWVFRSICDKTPPGEFVSFRIWTNHSLESVWRARMGWFVLLNVLPLSLVVDVAFCWLVVILEWLVTSCRVLLPGAWSKTSPYDQTGSSNTTDAMAARLSRSWYHVASVLFIRIGKMLTMVPLTSNDRFWSNSLSRPTCKCIVSWTITYIIIVQPGPI